MNTKASLDFLNIDINKKIFSIIEYNDKRNIQLKSQLNNINFDKLDDINSLLNQYQKTKDKNLLKIIKTNVELNKYDIKGICHKYKDTFSSLNIYTDLILDELKYNIEFDLYKISDKENNKVIKTEKNKYSIILLNINEKDKKILEKNLMKFQRCVLLFTNLEAKLEFNSFNEYSLVFKSTYKTKIYMEKNKITDIIKAKTNFLSSGIYIDYLKSNEFSFLNYINTQTLFSLKENKLKNPLIKAYNFEIDIDLKTYLEIQTESLYLDNSIDKWSKHFPLNGFNINLCCFVKKIYSNKEKKIINIIIENLFDLNVIILEIPKGNKILEIIHINCIYLFINCMIFIDEKMNIKLTLKDNMNEKSKVIFLYFLIDPEKYNHKKINDAFTLTPFSQLLPLTIEKKIMRIIQKYFVMTIKINFINIYYSTEGNEVTNYDAIIKCSDGTSIGYFYMKGSDISELKKLKININIYLSNKTILDKRITIYPNLEEDIQLIIIGNPITYNVKELSFLDIYENINDLKGFKNDNNKIEELLKFDLLLTKSEFTLINGSFSKKNNSLEEIPIIKVLKFMTLDEYINLLDLHNNNNRNEGI